MRFALPQVLTLLLALPVLAFLLWAGIRRQRRLALRLAVEPALESLASPGRQQRRVVRAVVLLVVAGLVIVAAARPQWGHHDQRIVSRGVDLIVAVDTSTSMLAQDYKPSRMERAKSLLQDILWQVRGDRIGIMAFAGEALVKCPLTLDYTLADMALESLDITSVAARGTAVGTAIETAIKAFDTGSPGERVLVLLTDGEDQGSEPIVAAQRAKEAGVRIYAIGIGSTEGMPIPLPNGTYKQDSGGKLINTRLDFDTLAKIAQATGGKAIRANPTGRSELTVVMQDIAKLQKASQQDRVYRVYTERYHWFLIPALVLLTIEALFAGRPRFAAAYGAEAVAR